MARRTEAAGLDLVKLIDLEREQDVTFGTLRAIVLDHEGDGLFPFSIVGRAVLITRETAEKLMERYHARRHGEFRQAPGRRSGKRVRAGADSD